MRMEDQQLWVISRVCACCDSVALMPEQIVSCLQRPECTDYVCNVLALLEKADTSSAMKR